jgi:hypothetical protein
MESVPHLFLFALPSSTTTAIRKQKPGRGRRDSSFLGRIIFSLCVIIALGSRPIFTFWQEQAAAHLDHIALLH